MKIDDTSAQQDLATARPPWPRPRQHDNHDPGPLRAGQAVDNAGVRSAQTSLDNARNALKQAKASYRLDKAQQDKLVANADDPWLPLSSRSPTTRTPWPRRRRHLAAAQAAGDTAAVTQQQTTITQLQTAIVTDKSAIDNAEAGLTQAKQTRDKTLLAGPAGDRDPAGPGRHREGHPHRPAGPAGRQPAARPCGCRRLGAGADRQRPSRSRAGRAGRQEHHRRAPVDGTVADISAVVGQSSSDGRRRQRSGTTSGTAGTTLQPAPVGGHRVGWISGLVTLVNDQAKQVTASVAEADIVKVKPGQSVSVTLPASGTTLKGAVTSVATKSTVINNVVEFDVAVSLPTADSTVRLGQTANVTITTATKPDVLYVPTSAITTGGGHTSVTRRSDGVDSIVEVETGLVGSNGTEIVRGLAEGDELVLPTGNSDTQDLHLPRCGRGVGRARLAEWQPERSMSTRRSECAGHRAP